MGSVAARLILSLLAVVSFSCGQRQQQQQSQLPPAVQAKIRNAGSLSELKNTMNIRLMPAPQTQRPTGARLDTRNDVEVIDDPKQSNDSCKLINVCVPLPVDIRHGVLDKFPECIDLEQCLGGCCNSDKNCHPIAVEPIKVKMLNFSMGEDGDILATEVLVMMERHKKCSCESCPVQPDCNDRQQQIDCQCQCKNHYLADQCAGENMHWSEETCECQCLDRTCPQSQSFDAVNCRCVSRLNVAVESGSEDTTNDHDQGDWANKNRRLREPTSRRRIGIRP